MLLSSTQDANEATSSGKSFDWRYKDDIRCSVEIYQDDQPFEYVANRSVEDITNPFTGTRHIKSPFRLGQYLKKKSKDMDDFLTVIN